MPIISPRSKISATRSYGANIVFSGPTSQERVAVCERVQKETNAIFVPPYDHPDVVLGQGTVGLEMVRQVGEIMGAKAENERDGKAGDEKGGMCSCFLED